MVRVLKNFYFYLISIITFLIFLKCYEIYFFNDFFIKVPNLVSLNYKDIKIKSLNIKVEELDSNKPIGTIIKQKPLEKEMIKRGSNIKIFVSKGSKEAIFDVIGYDITFAEEKLKDQNISIDKIEYIFDEQFSFNEIIATYPSKGELIDKNQKISLLVSRGSENDIIFIPDIIGLNLEEARRVLEEEKLIIKNISYKKSTIKKDIVIDTYPKVGDKVSRGELIDITISKD